MAALISVLTACGGKSTTETKFHVIFDNEAPPHHAFGHTPGHTLYRSGDLLIAGDIMHGVALQKEHPEFCARYDMDKEQAIASRKAILELVKKEGGRCTACISLRWKG